MKYKYYLLDVFTDKKLAGNPLAVVMKADNLSTEKMQMIAAEFNLPETVFVHQPHLDRHSGRLRIFTTKLELPFAGHPTVGAAVVLGLVQGLSAVRLEEKVGLVTCVMEKTAKSTGTAHFSLPQMPEHFGEAPDAEAIAGALGLRPEDIGCDDYHPTVYSAGVPYYLVPVKNTEALARITLELRGWKEVFPLGHQFVYAFTTTPQEKDNTLAARSFTPSFGMAEDPATGSAAAALIGLLANHVGDGQYDLKLRQGHEMGRPSEIVLRFKKAAGILENAGIGGSAVILAEGELDLSE